MRLCVVMSMCTLLFTSDLRSEWVVLPPGEGAQLVAIAESTLESLRSETERGWCRALVGTNTELELCWDKDRVGVRASTVNDANHELHELQRSLDLIASYSNREQWVFFEKSQTLFGYGGKQSQRLRPDYDCRQHSVWLTMMGSSIPEMTHLGQIRAMKTEGLEVSRFDESRIRISSGGSMIEFDLRLGFCPVLLEFQMDMEKVWDPKLARPIREKYDVAQDAHGVWYCKAVTRTIWEKGGGGNPKPYRLMEIVEYDSNPPVEQFRLDYKTLGLPIGTPVRSNVPGKAGVWAYGRESEGRTQVDGEMCRKLGVKMQSRGFSRKDRGFAR